MMDKFWELLKESVIVQGILTLMVVGTWLYMLASGQPAHEHLDNVVGLVIGFYFGGKYVQALARVKRGN